MKIARLFTIILATTFELNRIDFGVEFVSVLEHVGHDLDHFWVVFASMAWTICVSIEGLLKMLSK